jgi:predicted DNA-binding protein (UPF0278 family)
MENSTMPPMDEIVGSSKYELTYTEVIMDDMTFEVELPEYITIETLSRASEIRTEWRQGMKELEDCFQNVLSRMSETFDSKIGEYDRIRGQIVINHEFLMRYYEDMRRKLNEKHARILGEKSIWESQVAEVKDIVKLDSEVVALNVGGTHHLMTERDVLRLCPGSDLEKMFNGMHELKKINEEVFLDRDG